MAPRHPVSDCVWNIWKFKPFFLYGNSFVFDTYATQKPDAILSRPGDPHTSICQILIQIFAAGDPPLSLSFPFFFLLFLQKIQFLISGMQRSSVRISAVFRNGREGKKGWRQEVFFIFQNLVLSSLFFEWLSRISEIRNQNAVSAETGNFHFDLVPQKKKENNNKTPISHTFH